ncbi:MAG: hypothetical protein AB2710_16520 [Candidatus Thiodiazotropha sp.]
MEMRVGREAIISGSPAQVVSNDHELQIDEFFDGAQKRMDTALLELESERIASCQRKVLVKLFIELNYLKLFPSTDLTTIARSKKATNGAVQDAVLRISIDVKVDYKKYLLSDVHSSLVL